MGGSIINIVIEQTDLLWSRLRNTRRFEVSHSGMQPRCIVLKAADPVVAVGAEQAAYNAGFVAVINGQSFQLPMPNHAFRPLADSAYTCLSIKHALIFLGRQIVVILEVLVPKNSRPILFRVSVNKRDRSLRPHFPGLFHGYSLWIFNQIFYAAIASVTIPETEFLRRSDALYVKPHCAVGWYPYFPDIDASERNRRPCRHWTPMTRDIANLNDAGEFGIVLPAQRQWLVRIIGEHTLKIVLGNSHNASVALSDVKGARQISRRLIVRTVALAAQGASYIRRISAATCIGEQI